MKVDAKVVTKTHVEKEKKDVDAEFDIVVFANDKGDKVSLTSIEKPLSKDFSIDEPISIEFKKLQKTLK